MYETSIIAIDTFFCGEGYSKWLAIHLTLIPRWKLGFGYCLHAILGLAEDVKQKIIGCGLM